MIIWMPLLQTDKYNSCEGPKNILFKVSDLLAHTATYTFSLLIWEVYTIGKNAIKMLLSFNSIEEYLIYALAEAPYNFYKSKPFYVCLN